MNPSSLRQYEEWNEWESAVALSGRRFGSKGEEKASEESVEVEGISSGLGVCQSY